MTASFQTFHWSTGQKSLAVKAIRMLVDGGAKVNALDIKGRNVLFYARNAEVAKALLSAGAKPALRDASGQTAAELAELVGSREQTHFPHHGTFVLCP